MKLLLWLVLLLSLTNRVWTKVNDGTTVSSSEKELQEFIASIPPPGSLHSMVQKHPYNLEWVSGSSSGNVLRIKNLKDSGKQKDSRLIFASILQSIALVSLVVPDSINELEIRNCTFFRYPGFESAPQAEIPYRLVHLLEDFDPIGIYLCKTLLPQALLFHSKSLESFSVISCSLSSSGLFWVESGIDFQLENLKTLGLVNINLSAQDEGPFSLHRLCVKIPKLKNLDLSSNRLQLNDIAVIFGAYCNDNQTSHIHHNPIELKSLNLSFNCLESNVNSAIISVLYSSFNTLKTLILDGNNLSVPFPVRPYSLFLRSSRSHCSVQVDPTVYSVPDAVNDDDNDDDSENILKLIGLDRISVVRQSCRPRNSVVFYSSFRLETLSLNQCKIDRGQAIRMCRLFEKMSTNLSSLFLNHNDIHSNFEFLEELPNLSTLCLYGNSLDSDDLEEISRVLPSSNLQVLSLGNVKFIPGQTESGFQLLLDELYGLKELKVLDLKNQPLEEFFSMLLATFKTSMKQLTQLCLSGTRLTAEQIGSLLLESPVLHETLEHLEVANIRSGRISSIIQFIISAKLLNRVDISGNKISFIELELLIDSLLVKKKVSKSRGIKIDEPFVLQLSSPIDATEEEEKRLNLIDKNILKIVMTNTNQNTSSADFLGTSENSASRDWLVR